MRHKSTFIVIGIAIYIVAVALFVYTQYRADYTRTLAVIDEKLRIISVATDYISGLDFHDRYTTPDALTPQEHLANITVLSHFCEEVGCSYAYGMVLKEGKVYFTNASHTAEEIANGEDTPFYHPYDDIDGKVLQAMQNREATVAEYEDHWGSFRTVALPRTSSGGRPYFMAADADISDVRAQLTASLRRSMLTALYLMLAITPFILILVRYLTREREYLQSQVALQTEALASANAKLQQSNAKLEQLAITDALTGLYNRRYLDETLHKRYEAAHRYGNLFSLIIIDIDDFKKVNDTYGHDVGDRVLQEVAALISAHIRKSDILGRWGGEEFLLLCPETDLASAQHLAEQMCHATANAPFEIGGMTISIGVLQFEKGQSLQSMVRQVDQALYRAKRDGKNQVKNYTAEKRW